MNVSGFLSRRYVGSGLAAVAGMLLALAFAPFDVWPLGIAMPAVLIWLWEGATPRRAAVLGFWFNAGTFGAGTYWLYIAIAQIGGAPLWLTTILMAGFVAIMGAYHALLGWLVARYLPARGALRWLLGIPAAWLLIEWFRSWFISGFGWLALGYSQADTWLGALAPVVGQFGIGYLVLLVAGAGVTLLLGSRLERIAAAAAVVVVAVAAFALRDATWTQPSGAPITVAVVQGAIPQDQKWIDGNLDNTLDLYRDLTRQAHGAQLIVWPESAIPDLINNHTDYLGDVYREASATGSALVLGAMREAENSRTGEKEYYNSVISMDRAVEEVGFYDKYHLVPFTEFVPVPKFVRNWLRLANLPSEDFNRGEKVQKPLEAAGQHIFANVCYEDGYGSTQLPALRSATMLVNVTNDAWFGHSTARYQHLQISQMRAREAGRPMVRAANTGVSAVIDERGHIVVAAPEYSPQVLRGSLQPRSGLTPYAVTGNWPIICLALVLSLASAHLAARKT